MPEKNTDKIIEIYKILLEQETSNHTIYITVLLGIVIILLGATWWWNKSGAKKEIHREVEKKFEKEKKNIINQIELDLKEKLTFELVEYKERILILEGDVARSIAISACKDESYSHSVYWLAKFLNYSLELKDSKRIRDGVEWILQDLELLQGQDKNFIGNMNSIHQWNFVVQTISKLPELLEKEKVKILEICKGRKEHKDV